MLPFFGGISVGPTVARIFIPAYMQTNVARLV
jgi:hypothetical protein